MPIKFLIKLEPLFKELKQNSLHAPIPASIVTDPKNSDADPANWDPHEFGSATMMYGTLRVINNSLRLTGGRR